jgi:expansin (peptidoglycan-binding protein)
MAAPPPSTETGPLMCHAEETHKGGLTQYDRTALGNCGEPWPSDDLYGAMATADYGASAVCGMCAEVTGPSGMKAILHVVDQCPIATNPKCTAGHIDLSHTAYRALVSGNNGEVPNSSPVSWHYVPCNVSGPISYHIKDGSSVNWVAVQVRNSRYGIAGMKLRKPGGEWQAMTARTASLAYFVADAPGATVDLQVTDINGQILEDHSIQIAANTDVKGHAQFPDCKH